MKYLVKFYIIRKLLAVALLIALTLCGCEGGAETATYPDHAIDTPAMEAEREEESRLQEALEDLCPYDRDEFN